MKKNIVAIHSLNAMQEGMLFHTMNNEERGDYCEQIIIGLEGQFSVENFFQAFSVLSEKHKIFRACYIYEKLTAAKQVILEEKNFEQRILDLREDSEDIQAKKIEAEIQIDAHRGYSLSDAPLVRFLIIRLKDDQYKILWSFHHIILDGWSVSNVFKELLLTYKAIETGMLEQEITTNKKDIDVYYNWLQNKDTTRASEKWSGYLEGYSGPVTPLFSNDNQNQGIFQSKKIILNEEISEEIKAFTIRNNITTGTFFQVIWGIIQAKMTNSNDIVFGNIVSGRNAEIPEIEHMIGLFINIIPLRVNYTNDESIVDLMGKIQTQVVDMNEYDYFPIKDIQNMTNEKDNLINNALILENYPLSGSLMAMQEQMELDFKINSLEINEHTNYPFNIIIYPSKHTELEFKYNTSLVEMGLTETIANGFDYIIEQVVRTPDRLVKDIQLVRETEKESILSRLDHSQVGYDQSSLIHTEFDKMVEKFPQRTALKSDDDLLTYQELDELSTKAAIHLQKQGMREQEFVCICLPGTAESIVMMLAILKAGGVYVPIDVDFPQARKEYILKNTKTRYVITEDPRIVSELSEIQVISPNECIEVDYLVEELQPVSINSSAPAYVIYTSGSTGDPKGVVIPHKNVIRLLKNQENLFDFSEDDIWLLGHSIAFDFSIWEIYGALLFGGALVIVSKDQLVDPTIIKEVILQERVTILNQTPQAFYALADVFTEQEAVASDLRNIIFGGEALSPYKLFDWAVKNKTAKLINMYGITETTVHVTYKELAEKDLVSECSTIGHPLPTLGVVILNDDLQVQPEYAVGEICVYGEGIAKEYLGTPKLTDEKFIQNPFCKTGKLYRSGDLGRLLPNGDIEYIGRKDFQVKIRGYRIELGEIEKALNELNAIQEAVVLDKKVKGYDSLWAYVVTTDASLNIPDLRKQLGKHLPNYMVPAYFVEIEAIPLTVNGKVDRKALLALEAAESNRSREVEEPLNEKEYVLIGVWKEVLQQINIGREDNFFELGGDSIKAIQVVSQLRKYGLNLDIKNVLKFPILSEQSMYVTEQSEDSISQQPMVGEVGLLPIQEEFLRLNHEAPDQFNHALMLKTNMKINQEDLQQVMDEMVQHHDSLRFRYVSKNGNVIQRYEPYDETTRIPVTVYQLEVRPEDLASELEKRATEIQQTINITQGPIAQAALFNTYFGDQYLLIIVHHLAVDGVSWRIILEDIELLLDQVHENQELCLPAKTSSYKDWVKELDVYRNKIDRNLWTEYEKHSQSELKKRAQIRLTEMEEKQVELNEKLTETLLSSANKAYNTTINDLLLAAFSLAYFQLFEQSSELLVMMEGHGRETEIFSTDLVRTVGWFTVRYPVKLSKEHVKDVARQIIETKEIFRKVTNNGLDYSIFSQMNEFELKEPTISFNYLGQLDQDLNNKFFSATEMPIGEVVGTTIVSTYLLDINLQVKDKKLQINLKYDPSTYSETEITELLIVYLEKLELVVSETTAVKEQQFTPSDFTYQDLSVDDLELLQNDLEDLL